MTTDNEPKTQAGRALLERASRLRPVWPFGAEDRLKPETIHKAILAIEAEAAAAPAAAEPPAHALILEGYDHEKGYRFRDPNAERAAQPPPLCPECGATYGR